jgi:serine/threonine protein kinase
MDDVEALPDMAPECTGFTVSTNTCRVDRRTVLLTTAVVLALSHFRLTVTDLYSLGCLLYRLTCGRPLFRVAQSFDLVYFHVAADPKTPISRDHHIMKPLSELIMRLLRKNAEERYQTAHGVLADIEELLGRWTAGLKIDALPFILGESDHRTRMILPTYPFARVHELGVLRETCEAAARKGGGMHVLMLKGGSGVGKTKLLLEARRIACLKRSIFGSAKFDQYKRDLPFSAYITILRSLVNVRSSERVLYLDANLSKCKRGPKGPSLNGRRGSPISSIPNPQRSWLLAFLSSGISSTSTQTEKL